MPDTLDHSSFYFNNLSIKHSRSTVRSAGRESAKQRNLESIRGALGDEVAKVVLANAVPEYSEIKDDLNDLGCKLKRRGMPQTVVEQVYNGQLEKDEVTLDTALRDCADFKSDTPFLRGRSGSVLGDFVRTWRRSAVGRR